MRRIHKTLLAAALALLTLQACSVLNPYKSKFTCPPGKPGKCQSMHANYRDSLAASAGGESAALADEASCTDCAKKQKNKNTPLVVDPPKLKPASYNEVVLQKYTDLVSTPEVPLVKPAEAMRVLVLPYPGKDNHLYMERYIYIFTERPQWFVEGME